MEDFICAVCNVKPCTHDLLCSSCYEKKEQELAAYKAKVAEDEADQKGLLFDENWIRFIHTQPSLSNFYTFNFPVLKGHKQFPEIDEYAKKFTLDNNNLGVGVCFTCDDSEKSRTFGLYLLRRLARRYFMKYSGLVSFDYVSAYDCLSDVFSSPADNFYASSDLLVLDSVDLKSVCDNKHELRAFTNFMKYRLDLHRPTIMIVNNPVSSLPKPASIYFAQAFPVVIN